MTPMLLPCPLCKGEAEYREFHDEQVGANRWNVGCQECGLWLDAEPGFAMKLPIPGVDYEDIAKQFIAESWNTRPYTPAPRWRDELAARAMQGLLASPNWYAKEEETSEVSYKHADAMIQQGKRNGGIPLPPADNRANAPVV